ncbi:MAG: transglutaminase family protein [Terrimicrobiaceae bacterium]
MQTTHRFSIKSRLRYRLDQDGWLLLNLAAASSPFQTVLSERVENNRGIAFREHKAHWGVSRFHGLAAPAGDLEITYEAEVMRTVFESSPCTDVHESLLIDLPSEVVRFLYPSRYCESDKLVRLAAKEFGHLHPGHERVAGICNWIYAHIDYQPGATDQHTSAVDCLTLRAGVCRDFAHLGVTICRALGIPARYGSAYAYLLPQQDYHAFFEVWLGERWWYYDATRLAPQQGFIHVGSGHDAADTSVATMSSSVHFDSMDISVEKLTPDFVSFAEGPVSF